MGLRDLTLYSIIRRNARLYGKKTAMIYGDQAVTYEAFLYKTDRYAAILEEAGLEKGERIGILSRNRPEFLFLFGAAAKNGYIVIPINWRLKEKELSYILSDGTPRILFFESEFMDVARSLIESFSFIDRYFVLDDITPDLAYDNSATAKITGISDHDVESDDDFILVYTAAVSGKPRGARLTHRNIITFNLQQMYYWRLSQDDAHLLVLPLFHQAGFGVSFATMHGGGCNVLLPKFDPEVCLKHIQEYGVTICVFFAPMLEDLMRETEKKSLSLSNLRNVGGIDKDKTIEKFEAMSGATYWTVYGQTETSGFVTFAPYSDRPGSAGVPCLLNEVEVVDEHGNINEIGKTGEIVVRGPSVFNGYWNLSSDETHIFFDGWHHTGDLGRFDEEGYLWYVGRSPEKALIKPGGENVYPTEVEKVVLEHPAVKEVVAIGIPDPQWGEAVKAVCVLHDGESVTESELVEFVANRIARFKKPKYVVFAFSLPKNRDGRIDRKKVKADYGNTYPK